MRSLFSLTLAAASAIAVFMLASVPASAQVHASNSQVYLRTATEVFAGPHYDYPRVDHVQPGRSVHLHGCLTGHDWCDVSTQFNRGWVPSHVLAVYQNNHYYELPQAHGWLAYPLITFVFDRYWADHYRTRSWYRDRDRYRNHHRYQNPRFDPRERWRTGPGFNPRERTGPGFDPRHRDHVPRDRNIPRPGERDYRGLPRRNDGGRDYRGMPRRDGGVGNSPRTPRVDTPSPARPIPGNRPRDGGARTPSVQPHRESPSRARPITEVE